MPRHVNGAKVRDRITFSAGRQILPSGRTGEMACVPGFAVFLVGPNIARPLVPSPLFGISRFSPGPGVGASYRYWAEPSAMGGRCPRG